MHADLVISYARYNLLVDDMDRFLTPALQAAGVGLMLASPLHLGVLTNTLPPEWHPGDPEVFEASAQAAAYCRGRGESLSSVAWRYCIGHPYAAPVLSGMGTVEQVERNLKALTETTSPELPAGVQAILAPIGNAIWPSGKHRYDDYSEFRFPGEMAR